MNHRLLLATLFLALATLLGPSAEATESGHLPSPGASSDSGYKVENLSADVYVGGTILLVKGEVRNLRTNPVNGYVVVHLQTDTREEIGTVEAELSKSAAIPPAGSGQLEVAINIAKFPKIKNVSIEFVSR